MFGYGSLVDPESFGDTLGRSLRPGLDLFEAELAGFGRRWNYGVMHSTGRAVGPDGGSTDYTLVALGIVEAERETVNGVSVGSRTRSWSSSTVASVTTTASR